MLVVYPFPPTRDLIFGLAWEWTVYLVQGVWRCLREDKQEHHPALFSYHNLMSNLGMEETPTKPMKFLLKSVLLLLTVTLSLTFSSCGGDDEPDTPVHSTKIVSGTFGTDGYVTIFETNHSNLNIQINSGSIMASVYTKPDHVCDIRFVRISYVGPIEKLNEIKNAPTTGWSDNKLAIVDGGGYVLTYSNQGIAYYVRMKLTTNASASGEIVGVNYEFQQFDPQNL